jgi:hypothetical protein
VTRCHPSRAEGLVDKNADPDPFAIAHVSPRIAGSSSGDVRETTLRRSQESARAGVGHRRKALIVAGVTILVVGLLWPWVSKLPLGRLPGDIVVEREGFRFYLPLTTGLLLRLVLSLRIWLFRK